LAKQILRSAFETNAEYAPLASRIKGIVFLATPHTGSGIANYINALGRVLRVSTAVSELKHNAALLRDLNLWFRNAHTQRGWKVRVYFETLATAGVRVVDETSADPGIARVVPTGVDTDHLAICKPERADFRVKQTIAMLEKCRSSDAKPPSSFVREILASPTDRLPSIRIRVEAALAVNPADAEALEGKILLEQMAVRARLQQVDPNFAIRLAHRVFSGHAVQIVTGIALSIGGVGALQLAYQHAEERPRVAQTSIGERQPPEVSRNQLAAPVLQYPRGYVAYRRAQEALDPNGMPLPTLTRLPLGAEIYSNDESLRARPFLASPAVALPPQTCLKVIGGFRGRDNVFADPEGGWLPVQVVQCTKPQHELEVHEVTDPQ
jgi:hypothetical protein